MTKDDGLITNPTNIEIPAFLTQALFEKALKNGFNNTQIMITELNITMGSASGDNYCSEIYRANITYTLSGIANKKIALIVKAMPFMEARGPVLEDLEVYDKEVKMYTETLPKISALLNGEYICAKCFYATDDPIKMIIFEDLKSLGYSMADRHSGLDEKHCQLVLSKLGRFHAASMILAEKEPKLIERFSFGLFRPNSSRPEFLETIFGNGLSSLIEVVETWPGYNNIFKKLQQLRINYMDKVGRHCNHTNANIKVLNHGDLWVNNMMFKYKDETPIEVVFVDYQMSFFTSPGIDINYFISTSSQYEMRAKKRDTMIETYYRMFVKTLLDLNEITKIPSYIDLSKEISSREFYGFVASASILPIVLLDKEASKASNMDNLVDEEQSALLRRAMYNGPDYVKSMKFLLKRFDELSILDDNY